MNEKRFISVGTSEYALLNPDHSSQSRPLNAHFEIKIRRALSNGEEAETAERAIWEITDEAAKPAPAVILSGLSEGDYPLFGSSAEASDFAVSLMVDDPEWSKSYVPGSDAIRFTYHGGVGTLDSDFEVRIYSDSFNSSAAGKGKAIIRVNSENFSQQFDDAFDDSYTISIAQMYVPKIISFIPKDISPVEKGRTKYLVTLGQEVLLNWEVSGDFLKSPTLTENGGQPETVSPDTPVKRVISAPADFCLSVKSNVLAALQDQRQLSFGISSAPSIDEFHGREEYCLSGQEILLDFAISNAVNAVISAKNSTETDKEVMVSGYTVAVKPVLQEESNRQVDYTLTARGFLDMSPETAQKTVSVFVSRWKQTAQKPASVPQHTEMDSVVRMFRYSNSYYCFSGQAVWQSTDGLEWKKLSDLTLPAGLSACNTAVGIYEAALYVVGGTKDKALYFSKYDLVRNQWSDCTYFGSNLSCAGGAFAFVSDDQMYYFGVQGTKLGCYNYSPDPFDCWGVTGYLELPAKALDVDSLVYRDHLYLAASCEDQNIYVYYLSRNLKDVGSPVRLEASSEWVRVVETNGQAYALSAAGVFALETGKKEDMMFETMPQVLGAAEIGVTGIGTDGSGWSFCF